MEAAEVPVKLLEYTVTRINYRYNSRCAALQLNRREVRVFTLHSFVPRYYYDILPAFPPFLSCWCATQNLGISHFNLNVATKWAS